MPNNDLPTTVISELDQEIIVMTLSSLDRLFELSADAVTLYVFYCTTAKLQSRKIGYTNKIKCSRSYVKRGLHWGNTKYHRVKDILLTNGFIEIAQRDRREYGEFDDVYIKINYLLNPHKEPDPSYKPVVSNETSGPVVSNETSGPVVLGRTTNAEKKNTRTYRTSRTSSISSSSSTNSTTSHAKTYSNEQDILTPPKKGFEQVLYPVTTKSHSSKEALVPCTREEIYYVAELKQVELGEVQVVHDQIMSYVENGTFKARWGKSTYGVLKNWVQRRIDQHEVEKLSAEALGVMRLLYSPVEQKKAQELHEQMKEAGLL